MNIVWLNGNFLQWLRLSRTWWQDGHSRCSECVSLPGSGSSQRSEGVFRGGLDHLLIPVFSSSSYLAAGLPLEAVKCLLRRYDLSALRAAVQITHLTNETESFKVYGHKYITECQLGGDWLAASQLIKEHEYFKVNIASLSFFWKNKFEFFITLSTFEWFNCFRWPFDSVVSLSEMFFCLL